MRVRKPRELPILQGRRRLARARGARRDKPRGRVLKDEAIYEIAPAARRATPRRCRRLRPMPRGFERSAGAARDLSPAVEARAACRKPTCRRSRAAPQLPEGAGGRRRNAEGAAEDRRGGARRGRQDDRHVRRNRPDRRRRRQGRRRRAATAGAARVFGETGAEAANAARLGLGFATARCRSSTLEIRGRFGSQRSSMRSVFCDDLGKMSRRPSGRSPTRSARCGGTTSVSLPPGPAPVSAERRPASTRTADRPRGTARRAARARSSAGVDEPRSPAAHLRRRAALVAVADWSVAR